MSAHRQKQTAPDKGKDGKKKNLTAKVKRKDVGHALMMFLLIFVALVMFSEMTLAIIGLFFRDEYYGLSFIAPIAIMPTISVIITIVIIYFDNKTNKMAAKFAEAFEKLYDKQVIPKIAEGLSATVYTQVSDVEEEINGIITYDRRVIKLPREVAQRVNAQLKY